MPRKDPYINLLSYYGAGTDGKYKATINTSVDSVPIAVSTLGTDPNIDGLQNLAIPGPNIGRVSAYGSFMILSMGVVTAEDLHLAQNPDYVGLTLRLKIKRDNDILSIKDFYLPYINAEINIGHFINLNDLRASSAYTLAYMTLELVNAHSLSMKGVDSSLDGNEYIVAPFIKIATTGDIQ